MTLLVILVVASVVLSTALRINTRENTPRTKKDFCHSDRNNLFGDLFSASLFLIIICFFNYHTFNPKSFCLMNPFEKMCGSYKESVSCTQTHNLSVKTGNGHYFDGFAGFFQRNRDKDSTKSNPLKCFLDIGRNSWFRFMTLDFGEHNGWTESSFVLIDGEFAPFQPRLDFKSLPRINFAWLLNQNISRNLGQRTTSTGVLIFAADSEFQLFYHSAEMTGLE